MPVSTSTKTVVILGASYAGFSAVEVLVTKIPLDWRIVVIDRNTHFNHLYAFPRVAVLPQHEHKVFIPYTNIWDPRPHNLNLPNTSRHVLIHGHVTAIRGPGPKNLNRNRTVEYVELGEEACCPEGVDEQVWRKGYGQRQMKSIGWDYLIYGLGARLPQPINVWHAEEGWERAADHDGASGVFGIDTSVYAPKHTPHPIDAPPLTSEQTPAPRTEATGDRKRLVPGSKARGMLWLKEAQENIRKARSVVVIGGGALGVQFASDIAAVYPGQKRITLVHSRRQLLNRFDNYLHEEALKKLVAMGVDVHLDSRVSMAKDEGKVVLRDGTEVEADLILFCTGQTPNTSFLAELYPQAINPHGLATVNRNLQIAEELDNGSRMTIDPRMFVAGDAADAFGALNAGHTAWSQARMCADNIVSLIEGREKDMQEYVAPPPGIKVSLGLDHAIYQSLGKTGTKDKTECMDDLNAGIMWESRGLSLDDMEDITL